jgi:F-box and leucine-rich repeat protein 14
MAADLTRLSHLCMKRSNGVGDGSPARPLAPLTGLLHLRLSWCLQVAHAGLAHLTALTNLLNLKLSWLCRRVSDCCSLVYLSALTSLPCLVLRGSQLDDAGLVHLCALSCSRSRHVTLTLLLTAS